MLRDESAGRTLPTPWDFHTESGVKRWPWEKGILPASRDGHMAKP